MITKGMTEMARIEEMISVKLAQKRMSKSKGWCHEDHIGAVGDPAPMSLYPKGTFF